MYIAINDSEDVKGFLWRWLSLENHCINFHLIDVGDNLPHVGPGLVATLDDLSNNDNAFDDICSDRSDEEEIELFSVESYQIGEGESQDADYYECAIMEQMMREHPIAFDDFISEFAECIYSLSPFHPVSNPAFDG